MGENVPQKPVFLVFIQLVWDFLRKKTFKVRSSFGEFSSGGNKIQRLIFSKTTGVSSGGKLRLTSLEPMGIEIQGETNEYEF